MINYKSISRTIRWIFAGLMALVVAIAGVAECNVLPIEGAWVEAFDAQTNYLIEVGMLFFVGMCILLALKSFDRMLKSRMRVIAEEQKGKAYIGIYGVRLVLLALPMLLGVLFYYTMLENWGLYYALASFVSSLFCLPSAEGVEIEMKSEDC